MNDPYTPPVAPPPPPAPADNWRLYTELSSLAMFVFPFGNVCGPLVLWLIKKDTSPEADQAGKKVLNFNLSWTIWIILSCGLGVLPWLIINIIAILKAANNERFEHPLTIAFLK